MSGQRQTALPFVVLVLIAGTFGWLFAHSDPGASRTIAAPHAPLEVTRLVLVTPTPTRTPAATQTPRVEIVTATATATDGAPYCTAPDAAAGRPCWQVAPLATVTPVPRCDDDAPIRGARLCVKRAPDTGNREETT